MKVGKEIFIRMFFFYRYYFLMMKYL
uniref:Uncharacterized protein n=1 Tax=Heterorhabditis bacteriophora TaxID=37862 RepID=A0A1I7WA52_HETBA